jgi:hypothetical protein
MSAELRFAVATLLWSTVGATGCNWSGPSSSGLNSLLRFDGAQAMSGSISDPPDEISATVAPSTRWNTIYPGVSNKTLHGVVGPNANAAAIGVPGDNGYWLVPALTPDSVDPEAYDFSTLFAVSPAIRQSQLLQYSAAGSATMTLSFRAVDDTGHYGTATTLPLAVDLADPTGTLVVSLIWDSPVDLDLHVLVPANNAAGFTEVWSKQPAADPTGKDGKLDFDSNAACTIDNRDRENVVWQGTPPSGHFLVRVEAFSLCGLDSAEWEALAYGPDASPPIGEASGVVTEASTRGVHGAGAGVTAFEFYFP